MEKRKKNFFGEEKVYMEITDKTKTFARRGSCYLLTNEQEWEYETVDRKTFVVCLIDTRYNKISPCAPLWFFTNHDPYWMKPERQFTEKELEEIKNYEKV